MRAVYSALFLIYLAACAPAVPDSGPGVGFDNSPDAQRARELALSGASPPQQLVRPGVVSSEYPAQPGTYPAAGAPLAASGVAAATSPRAAPGGTDDIAAQTAAALAASSPDGVTGQPVAQAPLDANAPLVSDENDFAAVSARRSIEQDAQHIEQTRAQYTVVEPSALPDRPGGTQPNIVQYALETSHPRGQRIYSRSGINLAAKARRRCAGYASADLAQMDFLAKGGPRRDKLGLDPDGDGYACAWNPAPYRQAAKN